LGFTSTPGVGGDVPAVSFVGNTASPQNVIINTSVGNCFSVGDNANVIISGVTMIASSVAPNAGCAVFVYQHARCYVGTGIRIGACAQPQFLAQRCGTIFILTGYTIFGGANIHWYAVTHGEIAIASGSTLTLTGTPGWSAAFAVADSNGLMVIQGITFSGASGASARYIVARNSTIATGTAGSTTYILPANGVAASLPVATGGIYD
jgi:hypothetical protein